MVSDRYELKYSNIHIIQSLCISIRYLVLRVLGTLLLSYLLLEKYRTKDIPCFGIPHKGLLCSVIIKFIVYINSTSEISTSEGHSIQKTCYHWYGGYISKTN